LGRQEQVSFENKEELLRLAHGILLQNKDLFQSPTRTSQTEKTLEQKKPTQVTEIVTCAMCSKQIKNEPITEEIDSKHYTFDCQECMRTFKKFKSLYGKNFP
jgi:hypothetical protein